MLEGISIRKRIMTHNLSAHYKKNITDKIPMYFRHFRFYRWAGKDYVHVTDSFVSFLWTIDWSLDIPANAWETCRVLLLVLLDCSIGVTYTTNTNVRYFDVCQLYCSWWVWFIGLCILYLWFVSSSECFFFPIYH